QLLPSSSHPDPPLLPSCPACLAYWPISILLTHRQAPPIKSVLSTNTDEYNEKNGKSTSPIERTHLMP
ncbi:hypothetical protein STEG23_001679, partial [Scotinomys teguina]